jgi:hypothetical protein
MFVYVQGWPLSMAQLAGRTFRDLRPIKVNETMTMEQLLALFKQPPLPPGCIKSLLADSTFVSHFPEMEGVLNDLYLFLACDDCESSSLAARQAKQALLLLFDRLNHVELNGLDNAARCQMLKKECEGWTVFKGFTDRSWELMLRLVDRGGGMLKAGYLKIMTGVGLATNASAAEELSDKAIYCGHCFNVGSIQTPSMLKAVPFLLEGTTSMYSLLVNDKTPRVTVTLTTEVEKMCSHTVESETKILDMPTFLSALSGTLVVLFGVMNKPNGVGGKKVGMDIPVEVKGWLGKTVVTPSLDSDNSTHLQFYHRIMFMGWPCTTVGQGCMPVQESRSEGIMAGCHPYDLTNSNIRGVDAAVDEGTQKLMTAIMEEAVQPQVSPDVVRKIASLWIPCRPLEHVNTEATREPGVAYHRVVCMESPCAPEYLSIIHEIRTRIVKEANRINGERTDSDGIILYALLEGLDSLVCADVKDKDIKKLTVIDSVKQALRNLNCPKNPVDSDDDD